MSSLTSSSSSSSSFEGVGDEVILVMVFVIPIVIGFLAFTLWRWRTNADHARTNDHLGQGDNTGNSGRTRPESSDNCAICLGELNFSVETNCGHLYCGRCFFEYFSRVPTGLLTAPKCPYCRQRVTMLLPYFSEGERQTAEPVEAEHKEEVLNKTRNFNRRFSGEPRSLMEQLRDLPMLIRHLWTYLWSGEGLDMLFRIRIYCLAAVSVFYVLLPIDVMPEAVFGLLGFVDDLLFISLFLLMAAGWFRALFTDRGLLQ